MKSKGVGIDIVDIKRFMSFKKPNDRFLVNNYTKRELDYCLAFQNPASHLAGTFAAKEAVFKALGKQNILFSSIEIRRAKNGKPEVWIKNKKLASVFVSISHTDTQAVAIALG
jgi:phosphopantetheine--protein transferase-like protein